MVEFFRIALYSIMGNKLRSAMTLLGVVIGVWAITSMQGVVEGFDRAIEQELSSLGSESFVVQKFPAIVVGDDYMEYVRRKNLTYEDALYLQENAVNIQAATAITGRGGQTLKYRDRKTSPTVQVMGTMPGYLVSQSTDLAEGRFLTDGDVNRTRQVVVLGQDVIDELFPYESPLDKRIILNGQAFTVIGALGDTPSTFGQSADNVAIVPITAFVKVFTTTSTQMSYNAGLYLRAWSVETVDEAIDEVTNLLRVRRKVPIGEDNDFEIMTAESLMDTLADFTLYIRIAAIGIAGISLLVAGIGIMNIMLVSVMERTKEIGTRKAVGGRRSHILIQFLIEAVLLSEFGALVGIALGIFTTLALSPLLQMEARVPFWAAIAALGYCSAIGIFFGLYPANRASKLDPIEALRYE